MVQDNESKCPLANQKKNNDVYIYDSSLSQYSLEKEALYKNNIANNDEMS